MTPTLDQIAAQVQLAQDGAGMALLLTRRILMATDEQARTELAQQAAQEAQGATVAAREALDSLQEAGAQLPSRGASRPAPSPLAELARVERSRGEALALLDALRGALPAAEALDGVRGDVLNTPVNGLRGTVWGEDLSQMIARLEIELYGPSERVTGGRE